MSLDRKFKLCLVAPANDVHTQRWAKYFAENGYEVHIISRHPFQDLPKNIELHVLKAYGVKKPVLRYLLAPVSVLFQIKKLIKMIKPDVIHCFSIEYDTVMTALSGFHPFLIFPWGADVLIYQKKSKIMRYAVPFALKRADAITCDGDNTRDAVIKMRIAEGKVKKIIHGVDIDKFKPLKRDSELRKKLGLNDAPTIISTRRFSHWHNIPSIIRAIPLVLKQVPDAKFVFIGEGEQKDEVMSLAKSLNVYDSTRFLGSIPNEELPVYLASSDIHVSVTVLDTGISVATSEAMACELPVIAADFGANRSWVEDGINGFVIPPTDHETLAEKIIFLLKNKELRAEFGKRNRKIIEKRNSYATGMKVIDNIYKELMGRRNAFS